MYHLSRGGFRRVSAVVGGALLTLFTGQIFAGVQATADKEVAQQQVAADNVSPFHFELSVGVESQFVFRGVNILPEVDIDVFKAVTSAIERVPAANGDPSFTQFLASKGLTAKQFAEGKFPTDVGVSHDSGIYYVDGSVSAYNFTLGAFYATQIEPRDKPKYFNSDPSFDAYHEFDAFLNYSRAFGPVRVTVGGTYYHVINNTDFDTAELNLGVTYTPPQFHYISASFSYNYSGAFNFSDYHAGSGDFAVNGSYLDGHYLEARLDGDVPVYKHIVTFNPYILVSAGAGILPRAFNANNLPTYVDTQRFADALVKPFSVVLADALHPATAVPIPSIASTRAAFNPEPFDRSFDLSNFQVGFRVPIYLTRYISIRGDFNYSRPLGNLDREPYNQKDQVWGGGTVTFSF